MKFLVENGADIEIPNRHGHTALMIASYREVRIEFVVTQRRRPLQKVEVVKYLLSLKADVNRFSAKGNTALHDAAEAGNVEVTRLLLEAGAILQKDEYGVTPLYSAAMLSHTEVIQVLFPHASYVEKRDCWKLLGATMIDKRMDMSSAIACWRNSFEYDELIRIANEPAERRELSDVATKIYGGQREVMTSAELDEISGDPEALRLQVTDVAELLTPHSSLGSGCARESARRLPPGDPLLPPLPRRRVLRHGPLGQGLRDVDVSAAAPAELLRSAAQQHRLDDHRLH